MARKGSLSRKTFFPMVGDQLVDETNGICWICVRANTFKDEHASLRYGLLKGYAGDEVLWTSIHDRSREWLEGINTILRNDRTYHYNDQTKTWQEET